MASLDDILTTQKNGVVAVNSLNQTTINQIGAVTSISISNPTVIFVGSGRIVNCSVIYSTGSVGGIYNATNYGALDPATPVAEQLFCIPGQTGVFPVNLLFTNGLTVHPGSGNWVNVTYSIG